MQDRFDDPDVLENLLKIDHMNACGPHVATRRLQGAATGQGPCRDRGARHGQRDRHRDRDEPDGTRA
jgi:hypothetical protein